MNLNREIPYRVAFDEVDELYNRIPNNDIKRYASMIIILHGNVYYVVKSRNIVKGEPNVLGRKVVDPYALEFEEYIFNDVSILVH